MFASCAQHETTNDYIMDKHWDLVFSTNAKGNTITTKSPSGFMRHSVVFKKGSVYKYININDSTSYDIYNKTGDYLSSRKFDIDGHTIFFEGRKYQIVFLDRNILIIKGLGIDSLVTNIYTYSKKKIIILNNK